MSVHTSIAETLNRIATVPSIIRTRNEETAFRSRHGGRNGDLNKRAESVLVRLERVAEKLEKAI